MNLQYIFTDLCDDGWRRSGIQFVVILIVIIINPEAQQGTECITRLKLTRFPYIASAISLPSSTFKQLQRIQYS